MGKRWQPRQNVKQYIHAGEKERNSSKRVEK